MANATDKKVALELWKEHCKRIQSLTELSSSEESISDRNRRIQRLQKDYAAFCEYYFPHFLTLRDKTTGEAIKIGRAHV